MMTYRRNTLVGETSEEREARHEHARDLQQEQLFDQHSVRLKMSKFHAGLPHNAISICLVYLQIAKCATPVAVSLK